MSIQVSTTIQQLMDKLFSVSEPHGGEIEGESAPEIIRFDSREVRKILKGRRLPRSRRIFRGFNSPPGRF